MNQLKIGVSGVRGIVGLTFTPHIVVQFSSAFASYLGDGRIFICEDARPSGMMVKSAVISAILSAGCEPVDLGICPIPAMQFAVATSEAAGGIAISAGHNPEEWNALKFVRSDGLYLNTSQSDELLDVFHLGDFTKATWDKIKRLSALDGAPEKHVATIISTIDAAAIRKRAFKVAIDICNGSCCHPAADLLDALGCRVAALNDDPGEPFPHDPEPTPANMRQLHALVRATSFDIGFMLDTSGERLALVTETGEPLSEETTLALCADFLLDTASGPIVTNLCTTRALDDIARRRKKNIIRTPVGQSYVAEAALKNRAAIAGEGSGGIIIPRIHYASDALAAVAVILDGLARRGVTLSEAIASLPKYTMLKKKIPLDYTLIFKVIKKVRNSAADGSLKSIVNLTDGVKMEWSDSWLHIRPSNTESLIRIIAEARTHKKAVELIELGEELIRQ